MTKRQQGTIGLLAVVFAICCLWVTGVQAHSIDPELRERLEASGQLQEFIDRYHQAAAKGVGEVTKQSLDMRDALRQSMEDETVDTFNVLVILAEYSDNQAEDGEVFGQVADFQHLLFSDDPNDGHYSMTEFYLENSYGQFYLNGTVAGWYMMPNTYEYYVDGNNGFNNYPANAQGLAEQAILLADADVDYTEFDNDGNGWIDGVFIVNPGYGAEQTGSDFLIWSHKWSLVSTLTLDGVNIRDYSMEPEEYQNRGLITIGVFCHEFGHQLGLPDLYDTDYSSAGVGRWSLMAGGSWNKSGTKPSFMDAWCKKEVGFLDVINVTENMQDVAIPSSLYNPVAYRLWSNGNTGNQYFLVENRQKAGNDVGIYGSGLLIYHVDESIGGNWDESHPLVAIEQADGLFHLENDVNSGDSDDLWSELTKTEFDDLSLPNTRRYDGTKTKTAIWDISAPDSIMYANFDINYSRPRFELQSTEFSDAQFGNGNGVVEVGETITFTFTVENLWQEATGVVGSMSADNPDIIFDTPSASVGFVAAEGGTADNNGSPIVFTIPSGFTPCIDSFYLQLASDNPLGDKTIGLQLAVGAPKILVVDDDNGDDYHETVTNELFAVRTPFDVHEKHTQGVPDSALLSEYESVIWLIGDERSDIMGTADIDAIRGFLNQGGNLFLTGQSLVKELATDDPTFLNDYLKADYVSDIVFPLMIAPASAEVLNGLEARLGNPTNQTDCQTINPFGGSVAEFDLSIGGTYAISYEGDYKLVLFSFGYENIGDSYASSGYATKADIMERILEFFSDEEPSLNPLVQNLAIEGEASLSNVLDHSPVFAWTVDDTTANPVEEFQVRAGTGNLCTNSENKWESVVVTGSDTSIVYDGDTLVDGGDYVFQVRVSNGVTWSEWTELSFRMNSVPQARDLISPIENEVIASPTPTLMVFNGQDADEDALEHQFEVYADPGLTQLVTSGTAYAGETQSTWTVDSVLTEDQQYFWRVRVFDGYELSGYTSVESFVVNQANQAPQPFGLLHPLDSAEVGESTPSLSWQDALDTDPWDVVAYDVQLAQDPGFATYDEVTELLTTSVVWPYALDSGVTYYWRVVARDVAGDSTLSSETRSFMVTAGSCCQGIRGNVNGDIDEDVNIADLTMLVNYLFASGPPPPCEIEADVNGDETVNVADLTYMVNYAFAGGPPPIDCN
jgi:immune inhibitor A